MPVKYSRRQFTAAVLPVLLGVSSSGCGTILYPERRGQPAGRLDWGVVALNGIGLLVFFVPGVIAFAVDFITGAIYLPPEGYGEAQTVEPLPLRRINVPRHQLTRDGIAHVVSEESGCQLSLAPDTYLTRSLDTLEGFWDARNEMAVLASGAPSETRLRSQSPSC